MSDDGFLGCLFSFIAVLIMLINVAFFGVVIWGIYRLVLHFT